jgi:hypothetical protein
MTADWRSLRTSGGWERAGLGGSSGSVGPDGGSALPVPGGPTKGGSRRRAPGGSGRATCRHVARGSRASRCVVPACRPQSTAAGEGRCRRWSDGAARDAVGCGRAADPGEPLGALGRRAPSGGPDGVPPLSRSQVAPRAMRRAGGPPDTVRGPFLRARRPVRDGRARPGRRPHAAWAASIVAALERAGRQLRTRPSSGVPTRILGPDEEAGYAMGRSAIEAFPPGAPRLVRSRDGRATPYRHANGRRGSRCRQGPRQMSPNTAGWRSTRGPTRRSAAGWLPWAAGGGGRWPWGTLRGATCPEDGPEARHGADCGRRPRRRCRHPTRRSGRRCGGAGRLGSARTGRNAARDDAAPRGDRNALLGWPPPGQDWESGGWAMHGRVDAKRCAWWACWCRRLEPAGGMRRTRESLASGAPSTPPPWWAGEVCVTRSRSC